MEKHDDLIRKIGAAHLQKYNESAKLRKQYATFADYLEYCIDRASLAVEYDRSAALKAEFGTLDRFVAYMMAEKKGLVKIIGNKI